MNHDKKNEIKNGFNLIQNDGHVITLCVSAIIIIKEEANTNPQKSEMDAYDLARMS